MAVDVFGWPPVGAVGTVWTFDQPSSVSVSALTGAARYSLIQPERRRARVVVSALARGRDGAGYSEVLKRLLQGGSKLVRLNSSPINWHLDDAQMRAFRQGNYFGWATASEPLTWIGPESAFAWFDGAFLTGTIGTSGGYPAITVSGLPPLTLVARPADFATVFEDAHDPAERGVAIMIIAPARSNAEGVAVIRLYSPAPYAARVSLGAPETAVFRATSIPTGEQPVGANWTLPWDFEEVFSAEVGGFTEKPDWWAET